MNWAYPPFARCRLVAPGFIPVRVARQAITHLIPNVIKCINLGSKMHIRGLNHGLKVHSFYIGSHFAGLKQGLDNEKAKKCIDYSWATYVEPECLYE